MIKDFRLCINGMNRVSRKYIRIGNLLIFTCSVLVLFCQLSAGFIGVYDNMIILRDELLLLLKNLISSFYVPAIVIEIIRLELKRSLNHL